MIFGFCRTRKFVNSQRKGASKLTLIAFVDSVIEQLGGKQLVMQHLSHEDPNVRYEALLAVQKVMVHNWYVN